MNIQQKQMKELHDALVSNQENTEMEFRFGKFVNKGFQPEISYETFLRLDKFLRKFCVLKGILFSINQIHNKTRNIKYYHPKGLNFDLPDENNDSWEFLKEECSVKEQLSKIDIKEYGIRFSKAKESETVWESPSDFITKKRKRIIYAWGDNIEFHLSKIKTVDINKIEYDIEIEVKNLNSKTFKSFMDFLGTTFLSCYQHTNKIMKNRTYKDILKDYQILVGSKKFIGSKAESLQYSKINFDEEYAVSQKFDGERKLLYFRKSRIIVLNYNNFLWVLNKEPLRDEIIEKYENSVFDCEYYNGKFYIFDTLFFKGKKEDGDLHERIEKYKDLVKDLDFSKILAKQYYFSENLYKNVIDVLNTRSNFITDGIILTPINEKTPPLKYKDDEPNTVDFKIKKFERGRWELFCYDYGKNEVLYENKDYNIRSIIYVSSNVDDEYTDDTVVEFYYDKVQNTFVPIRTRFDKQLGNFKKVVDDNLLLDLYSFRVQWLKKSNLTAYETVFYNINRFKHYFCRNVIKDYKNRGTAFLYSYNPNDIYKLVDNNIRNTFVLSKDEKSDQHLQQKIDRITSNKTTKNFSFTLVEDLPNEKITMMFSFEFYTVFSENKIKKIKSRLAKNGIIIVFYLENNEPIIDSSLFSLNCNKLQCCNKTFPAISQDLITLFKNQNINLVDTVKYTKYYDSWVYNNNFLNQQEKRFMNLFSYLVFKNE